MSAEAFTRADVCAIAIAEVFRGDGEILANPIGTTPMVGGRLARATFEPELMMTDSEAALIANDAAYGWGDDRVVETWNPYRRMFDVLWGGRRHVIMTPTQIDRYANMNFAAIGPDPERPKVQLLGFRGGPGNTISHTTSYWVPKHNAKTFVEKVDVVCGVGYDRAAALNPLAKKCSSPSRSPCVTTTVEPLPPAIMATYTLPWATAVARTTCSRTAAR